MTDADRITRLEQLVAVLLTVAVSDGNLPLTTVQTIAELQRTERVK